MESSSYRDTGQVLHYLYSIARNLRINEYHRPPTQALPEQTAICFPEEELVSMLSLKAALSELEPEEQELLLLRYTNKVPVTVICKIFQEKIETLLNTDYSYGNYTRAEKDYWLQKAKAVHTPFRFGSTVTLEILWNTVGMLFYLFFVVSILSGAGDFSLPVQLWDFPHCLLPPSVNHKQEPDDCFSSGYFTVFRYGISAVFQKLRLME